MASGCSGAPLMSTHISTQDLIGEHPSIHALRKLVARVAKSRVNTVLIYGETGTGKGLVARMIHQQSARADKEFLDINCAAIPGDLLAKILTLLDTQRFRRVGSVRPTSVDVRFIAATNKILLGEVKAGHFREDLYYRLQVIAINIPPLRERGDDIFILTERFMAKYNLLYGSHMCRLEPDVETIFRAYAWPGNVRELQNLLERICILEDGDCIRMEHLPQRIPREARIRQALVDNPTHPETVRATGLPEHAKVQDTAAGYQVATQEFQRLLIRQALDGSHGNLGRAANQLALTRHALRHQMLKLGLAGQDGEEPSASDH